MDNRLHPSQVPEPTKFPSVTGNAGAVQEVCGPQIRELLSHHTELLLRLTADVGEVARRQEMICGVFQRLQSAFWDGGVRAAAEAPAASGERAADASVQWEGSRTPEAVTESGGSRNVPEDSRVAVRAAGGEPGQLVESASRVTDRLKNDIIKAPELEDVAKAMKNSSDSENDELSEDSSDSDDDEVLEAGNKSSVTLGDLRLSLVLQKASSSLDASLRSDTRGLEVSSDALASSSDTKQPSYGKQPPSSNAERERAVNSMRNFLSAEKEERQARTASSGTPSRSSSREGSSARQTPAPSSSQSRDDLAATAQPVASGSSAISDRDTRKNLPHLSLDQVAKKIQFILEEFINNNNYQESALSVSETFPPSNMGNFVVETMNILLERSAPVRSSVGKLLGHLMKEGILTTEQFLEGFKEIAEVADDLAIDVPKVLLCLAETLVPMLSTEALSFSDLKTAATGLHKLVVEILRLLVKEKGPGWIRQRWDVAGMSWTDFAPADSIDRIVKENKLEFTVGAAGDSAALSAEAIHAKLLQMLRPEQGAPATTDEVTKWISANVGDRAKTPEFIRVLTTAVCESAYLASSSKKFEEALFTKYSTLLQKYIDTNEELELHCLYAVQELNHRLEQPSGLLCSLFQSLWDYGCVANETFLKWEQSKDPAFLQGKGIALKSLTAFFTALREADDDSSEECASGQ